jgi:hypothetical protein
MPANLTVRAGDSSTTIEPGETWSFGRDVTCDLVLGRVDRSISRRAGLVESRGDIWCLRNTSSTRPLHLVDRVGLHSTLAVGQEVAITDQLIVRVVGAQLTHSIDLRVERMSVVAAELPQFSAEATLMPSLSGTERATLAALAEGFLRDHPRYEPRPRTYAEAAERLGVPASTVRKRAERIRLKLVRAGVVGVEVDDARAALTEFVLATGLITAADLNRLQLT